MINVIFKGNQPKRATEGSAGYDLQSVENTTLYPGEKKLLRTGLFTSMPVGVVALVFIRSSVAKRGLQLMNHVAVIDADYVNEWMLMLHNTSAEIYRITEGDRLAQAVFIQYETPNFIKGEPTQGERTGGMGSSGV